MATILNKKNWFDTNMFHMLDVNPNTTNYTGCWASDGVRYIYVMQWYWSALFYRIDTFSKWVTQLASCPVASSTTNYQPDMCYDPSRNRIYAIFWGSTDWRYYDIDQNVWSWALTALPVSTSNGSCIKHCCPYYNAAGDDDFIYYIVANASSRLLYRYSISGNSWLAAWTGTWVTVASWINIINANTIPSSMAKIIRPYNIDPDKLYIFPWASINIMREFKISTVASVGIHKLWNVTWVWNVGSNSRYCADTKELFWIESGSKNINKMKMDLWAQITWTTTSATTTTLTDTSKSWEDNVLWGSFAVTITWWTGAGQTRTIKYNDATTLTVYPAWSTPLDSTSTYEIKSSVLDYWTATSWGTNTLTDSSKSTKWFTNSVRYAKVKIIAWTGIGQERFIASNTTTALTVDVNRVTPPDNTSVYEIIWLTNTPECFLPVWTSATYNWDTMEWFIKDWIITIYTYRKNWQWDWGYRQSMTP